MAQPFIQSRTLTQQPFTTTLNQPAALGSLQGNRSLGLSNQSSVNALGNLFGSQSQGLSNQPLGNLFPGSQGLSNQGFIRSPGIVQQQQFLPASQGFEDQGTLDYNVVTSPSRLATFNNQQRSLGLTQASPSRLTSFSNRSPALGRQSITPGSPIPVRSPILNGSPLIQSMGDQNNEGIGPASGVQLTNIPGPASGPIFSQPAVASDGTVVVSVTEVVNPANPVPGSPQASETIGDILLDANRTIAQIPSDPNRRTPAQETSAQSAAALANSATTTAAEMNFNTRTNPPPRNLVNPQVYSPSRITGTQQQAFRVQVPSNLPSPRQQIELNRQRTNAIGVSPGRTAVQTPGQLQTEYLHAASRRASPYGGPVPVSMPTLLYADQSGLVFGSRNPPGIETQNAINRQRISEGLAPITIVATSPVRTPQRRTKDVEDTKRIGDAVYPMNSRSGSLVTRIAHDEMLKQNPIPQPQRNDDVAARMLQAARNNAINAARSPLGQQEAARRIESIRAARVLANSGLSPTRTTPRRQTPSQFFRPV